MNRSSHMDPRSGWQLVLSAGPVIVPLWLLQTVFLLSQLSARHTGYSNLWTLGLSSTSPWLSSLCWYAVIGRPFNVGKVTILFFLSLLKSYVVTLLVLFCFPLSLLSLSRNCLCTLTFLALRTESIVLSGLASRFLFSWSNPLPLPKKNPSWSWTVWKAKIGLWGAPKLIQV